MKRGPHLSEPTLPNSALADELTQDMFPKAFQVRERLSDVEDVRVWLMNLVLGVTANLLWSQTGISLPETNVLDALRTVRFCYRGKPASGQVRGCAFS